MYMTRPAFYFLALITSIHICMTAPIDSQKKALTSRQLENFSSADDSGALYDFGTPVAGTNSWRDADGVYHDHWK